MNAEPPRRRRPIQASPDELAEDIVAEVAPGPPPGELDPGAPPLPPAPTVMPEGVDAITHETQAPSGTVRRMFRRTVPTAPRPVQVLALIFLGMVTGGAVFALGYDLVVNGSETAANSLGLIATAGLGGLLVAAGAKGLERTENGGLP